MTQLIPDRLLGIGRPQPIEDGGRAVIRVLAIGHSYVLAANRSILRELARNPEFQVTVAAPQFFHGDLRPLTLENEPAGSALRVIGLRAYLTRWIYGFTYHPEDLRAVTSGDYAVIHAWEEPYILSGYQIARAAARNERAAFCFRTAQNNIKRYPPPFTHFERSVVRRADRWIAGGHLVYEAMCQKGFPADRGEVITLSVDTSQFQAQDAAGQAACKAALGLSGPVIGFLGRFTRAKGVDVLLAALERVGFESPWSLLMLGSGPLEGDILEWARRHGVQDRVQVRLVHHNDVPNVLPALDMMVAPSQTMRNWREQFGRMTIEAFAAGVPVITSTSGEIPTVAGDAAIVVPERDIDGWARAIQTLLTDAAQRTTLRERGLRRAEEFSSTRIAAKFAGFYRDMAARKAAP